MNKNITWIVSYPKSGNTWFRIFLANLFSSNEDPVNINELFDTPIFSRRSIIDKYAGVNTSDLTRNEIDLLRPKIYRNISKESSTEIYIKVHDAWRQNSDGEPIFPADVTKGVIYILRNPLDVAISYANHSSSTLESTIKNMNDSSFSLCGSDKRLHLQLEQKLFSWSDHIMSWCKISGLSTHTLKYEEMIQDPLKAFSSALNYLRLEYSEYEINKAIKNSSFELLQKQEEEHGFLEKPINSKKFFRSGKMGIWSKTANKEIFKPLLDTHEVLMKQYGYF